MPRPQLRRAQEEVPGGHAWPAGQPSQAAEPLALAKVPPGQGEHEGALVALLKEPGRHATHLREVKLAEVPGEHGKLLTRRILLPFVSATYTVPEESAATPRGKSNSAAEPTPFEEPNALPVPPPPASVMTVRLGNMRRSLWLKVSAT